MSQRVQAWPVPKQEERELYEPLRRVQEKVSSSSTNEFRLQPTISFLVAAARHYDFFGLAGFVTQLT